MTKERMIIEPEHTSVRVALWRALHLQIDSKPHIFKDSFGLQLVGDKDWQSRPDMEPTFCRTMRASIVARARFLEDLVFKQIKLGVDQYVILGAGLDTFAQRNPDLSSKINIFEIDKPGPQRWKKNRLKELGLNISNGLHFVPFNFKEKQSWWDKLKTYGFDSKKPSIVVSTGVSMYLTKEETKSIFDQVVKFAPGSTFAMTFLLTPELLNPEEKSIMNLVMEKAHTSGTPFLSLFSPMKIRKIALESGFKEIKNISADKLYQLYFSKRSDDLDAGKAENILVAKT